MKLFGNMKLLGKWTSGKLVLGAALAAATLGMGAANANAAQVRIDVAIGAPVVAPVAYVPACPGPGYVWVGGYWNPYHVWIPGYWRGGGMHPVAPVVRGRLGFYDAHRGFDRHYDRFRR